MRKELKDLIAAMTAKKEEVRAHVAANRIEEAKTAKAELIALQDKFDLLSDIDDEEQAAAQDHAAEGKLKPADGAQKSAKAKIENAFVNLIRCAVKKTKLSGEDAEILNSMNEQPAVAGESDGGFTVPEDIANDIRELRRSDDNLEEIVNVEPVSTKSGSRPIEKDADTTAWPEVAEEGSFGVQETPKIKKIEYSVKKFGGILKISAELLEDTAANILRFLKRWIAKKTRATRNARILAAFDTIAGENTYGIAGTDDLKDIFNVELDPAIAAGAVLVTNQSGFNAMDKWKDENGKYIIQSDATQKTKHILFGKYQIIVLSNKILKNVPVKGTDGESVIGHKYPVYCGDTREAVTLFDRKLLSINISNVAGQLWQDDQTGVKVRDRFDVKAVDTSALKKGYIEDITAPETEGEA